MYIATRYVGISGRLYAAGEAIPDMLSEDQIAWLLKSGAVEKTAPARKEAAPEAKPEEAAPEAKPEEAAPKAVKKPAAKKTAERRKGK